MAVFTIPDPPALPPIPVALEVPRFDVTIPEARLDFAYQQYTGVVLAVVESQLDGVAGELDNYFAVWEGQLNALTEGRPFDLVTALGYRNPSLSWKGKELAFLARVMSATRETMREALRVKNLQLYLEARLTIEKERLRQHTEAEGVRLAAAKELIAESVARYDVVLKGYAARVEEVRAHRERVRAVIEQNDLRIKLYEALLEVEKQKGEINKNLVDLARSEVAIQRALLEAADAQMELQRTELKVEAMQVEVLRLQTQVLITGSERVIEAARQADIAADIDLISAQLDEIRVIKEQVEEARREAELVSGVAAEKLAALTPLLAQKEAILAQYVAAADRELAAERTLANREVEAKGSSLDVLRVEGETRAAEIEARGAAAGIVIAAQGANEITSAQIELARVQADIMVEGFKLTGESMIESGRAKAADTLKDARIINHFKEHR